MNYLKCQNSKKFVRLLADRTGLTLEQSKEAYIGLRKLIMDGLVYTGEFVIPGVGKFEMRRMKERRMAPGLLNVKRKQLVLPAHEYVAFKFFQRFRRHLKEDMAELKGKQNKNKEEVA